MFFCQHVYSYLFQSVEVPPHKFPLVEPQLILYKVCGEKAHNFSGGSVSSANCFDATRFNFFRIIVNH